MQATCLSLSRKSISVFFLRLFLSSISLSQRRCVVCVCVYVCVCGSYQRPGFKARARKSTALFVSWSYFFCLKASKAVGWIFFGMREKVSQWPGDMRERQNASFYKRAWCWWVHIHTCIPRQVLLRCSWASEARGNAGPARTFCREAEAGSIAANRTLLRPWFLGSCVQFIPFQLYTLVFTVWTVGDRIFGAVLFSQSPSHSV